MRRPKYQSYAIASLSGAVERWRVPQFISPEELARLLPHHLIFQQARIGFTYSTVGGFLTGRPGHLPVLLWHTARSEWLDTGVDLWPETEADAYRLYRYAHRRASVRKEAS